MAEETVQQTQASTEEQQAHASAESSSPEPAVDDDFLPEPELHYHDEEHIVAGIPEREGYIPQWLVIFIACAIFLAATMWIRGRYY